MTFQFHTKATTLDELRNVLVEGIILPQVAFTIKQWQQSKTLLMHQIKALDAVKLVVRSSAINEDGNNQSLAGAFRSVLGVEIENEAINEAVEQVIQSYGPINLSNQILVQPQLTSVMMSGVIFSCDLRSGAPYYSIHYDLSGSTDGVTSGGNHDVRVAYIYRDTNIAIKDWRMEKLVACMRELESITGNSAIDVEFAYDSVSLLPIVFQVRPIAARSILERYRKTEIADMMRTVRHAIVETRAGLLSDMADWNPAELIGSHPRRLARDLFGALIGNKVWRDARQEIGYFAPKTDKLMHVLGGHPYINVRASFESYVPVGLEAKLREKLVEEAIEYLKTNPHLHDKVEFDVALNCFTLSFDKRAERLLSKGFTVAEVERIREVYRKHTIEMIRSGKEVVEYCLADIEQMDKARAASMEMGQDSAGGLVDGVRFLLKDCAERGTKRFATIARLAFVGNALLRSLVAEGFIAEQEMSELLQAIPSIPATMVADLERVAHGRIAVEDFLKEYGHLRPGTFDITSPRYDEAATGYLRLDAVSKSELMNHQCGKGLSAERYATIDSALVGAGVEEISAEVVVEFVRVVTEARERAKFIFTRSLSDSLQAIVRLAQLKGLSRDEASYLSLEEVYQLANYDGDELVAAIEFARSEYEREELLLMPDIVAGVEDVEMVVPLVSRPNFVTQKSVEAAPYRVIGGAIDPEGLRQKIVCIESADPGYDWVFLHDIAGLVTKYGGAGSHMAIRCAELDMPAAIGVGNKFEDICRRGRMRMDCANKLIV